MAAPSTPRRVIANSGKKRAPLANLSRPSPGVSHGTKMASIFHDAARSLESMETPSRPCLSNTKRSRIPLSQAKSTRFGSLSQGDGQAFSHIGSPTPIRPSMHHPSFSSTASTDASCMGAPTPAEVVYGQQFPTPLPYRNSLPSHPLIDLAADQAPQVTYPVLDSWRSPQALSTTPENDFTDEECHSTHGVPLILPLRPLKPAISQTSSVDSWLEEVLISSSTNTSSTSPRALHSSEPGWNNQSSTPPTILSTPPAKCSTPSTKPLDIEPSPAASSNKENQTPIDNSPSSSSNKENHPPYSTIPSLTLSSPRLRSPTTAYLSAHLSDFGLTPSTPSSLSHPRKALSTRSASARRPPRTPPGQLTQPPKRQKAASTSKKPRAVPKWEPQMTFTIHEDETAEPVVELSPEVETFRKGKGRRAKRERCASYWDEDILGRGTGTERESDMQELRGAGKENVSVSKGENVRIEIEEKGEFRNGRAVLVETERCKKMRKEKAFCEEAEEKKFEFMVKGLSLRKGNGL